MCIYIFPLCFQFQVSFFKILTELINPSSTVLQVRYGWGWWSRVCKAEREIIRGNTIMGSSSGGVCHTRHFHCSWIHPSSLRPCMFFSSLIFLCHKTISVYNSKALMIWTLLQLRKYYILKPHSFLDQIDASLFIDFHYVWNINLFMSFYSFHS